MRGWPLVLAISTAGCLGDQHEPAPDAPPAPDGPAPITLQFAADEIDLADLPVYFQAADSTLALATRTDATGRARGFLDAGGYVTIVLPGGGIYTYGGVREGDQLQIDERSFLNETEQVELALQIPQSPGADVYVMSSTCGIAAIELTEGVPASTTITACASTSDVVITARYTEPRPFGSNHRYLFRADAPLDPSAPLMLDGEFQPLLDSSISVTAMPSTLTRVTLSQLLVRDRYEVTSPKSVTVDAVDGVAMGKIGKMYAPEDGTTLTRVVQEPDGVSAQTTIEWGPSEIETAIDGATQLRALTAPPALIATANLVQWTEDSTGSPGDLVFLELAWSSNGQARRWRIAAPRGDASELRLPVLPKRELVPPSAATLERFATLSIGADSTLRTTLLGGWPAEDAWLADGEAGRVDYRALTH